MKILYSIMIVMLLSVNVYADESIVTLSTGEWAPYTSEYLLDGGICSEIVKAAFDHAGIETALEFYPWTRAIKMMERGRVTASYPWVKRSDIQEYALYSSELHVQVYSFFYYKKFFPKGLIDDSVEDLKKYRIGVGKGYFYAEQLNAMGFHTIPVTSTSNGMLMLLRGHIDLMTEDSVVGKYLISTLLPGRDDEFGEIQAPLESESVYLLFSKKKKVLRSW